MQLQGRDSLRAMDFGWQGMILPVLVEVALPWGRAVGEITPAGQGPFLFLCDEIIQASSSVCSLGSQQ